MSIVQSNVLDGMAIAFSTNTMNALKFNLYDYLLRIINDEPTAFVIIA